MPSVSKFFIILTLFALLPVHDIFTQQAQIQELTGTVELQYAGSDVWVSAYRGQLISEDTVISTGFRSSALVLLGSSFITVRPLTRLSIAELSQRGHVETINLYLHTGRVRVEVNSPAGRSTNLGIQTPSTVASVRGTAFEFDTINLMVDEGTVEFSGALHAPVLVDAGAFSFADDRSGRAARPEDTLIDGLRPALPIAFESSSPMGEPAFTPAPAQRQEHVDFATSVFF